MRIDAHQHFWKVDRGDYGWLTSEMGKLYRDFLPEDLLPHLEKHQIDRTILVQAAPTKEETDFLLHLYEQTPFIAGVVGWLDLAADDFPEEFERYRKHPGFKGLRPMLQDLPDDRWILQPQVLKNIELLVQEDFPLDILVFPRHLPHILELLETYPTLRAVIDHAAKPAISQGILEPWKDHMAEIASYKQVMCKLSGLITEADHQAWKKEELFPYIQHVLNVFGPHSVLFGSDWPVCLLAGSYDDVLEVLTNALPPVMTEEEKRAIFGGNAMRFYQLEENSK